MKGLFIRAGKLIVNLLHVIYVEDDEPARGEMRVKVLPGEVLELRGRTAQEMRLGLAEMIPAQRDEATGTDIL